MSVVVVVVVVVRSMYHVSCIIAIKTKVMGQEFDDKSIIP